LASILIFPFLFFTVGTTTRASCPIRKRRQGRHWKRTKSELRELVRNKNGEWTFVLAADLEDSQ